MRRQCFVHDDIYACGNACKYMYVRDTGADQQNSWQPRTGRSSPLDSTGHGSSVVEQHGKTVMLVP